MISTKREGLLDLQLGPMIVDIDSVQLTEEESDYLRHPFVWAVSFYFRKTTHVLIS